MREVPFMLFYRSASEVSAIQYRDCFPSILPTLEIELSAYHLTTSFFCKQAQELFIRIILRKQGTNTRFTLVMFFKAVSNRLYVSFVSKKFPQLETNTKESSLMSVVFHFDLTTKILSKRQTFLYLPT